jgi:hypothetical protein
METKLTMDDVWGKFDDNLNLISRGMVVAQGYIGDQYYEKGLEHWKNKLKLSNVCPVWGDEIPYKSVTVICNKEQEDEVRYWLCYVHGGGAVEKWKELPGNKVAIRSNYMCW